MNILFVMNFFKIIKILDTIKYNEQGLFVDDFARNIPNITNEYDDDIDNKDK